MKMRALMLSATMLAVTSQAVAQTDVGRSGETDLKLTYNVLLDKGKR